MTKKITPTLPERVKAMLTKTVMLVVLILATTVAAWAQSIDFKSVDINALSEEQVKEYATKIKKQGFTMDMVLEQAKMRGATNNQLSQIKRRFSRYFSSSNTSLSSSEKARMGSVSDASDRFSTDEEIETSTKVTVQASSTDSLVFGFSIFNKQNLSFAPSTSAVVPDSYVIGIGDGIGIDISGASDQSYELTVNMDGTINVPMIGPIKVSGLSLEQARTTLRSKLSRIYGGISNGTTSATIRLNSVRPVNVSVMGEAYMPGTFTVSSAASLFHVLYLCGGPNSKGSYRDVQLIRGGQIICHLDVYDLMLNGSDKGNVQLRDGDIIMIPTYAKRVAVSGEFKRTGYFEAKEGETVEDLIRFAGGFTPRALTEHLGLFRVGRYNSEYKQVTDPRNIALASGDSLVVSAIDITRLNGSVSISGAVFAQGYYEYAEGMTLSQLITKAGGLKENAFLTRGVVTRLKEDYTLEALNFNVSDVVNGSADLTLKDGDRIAIAYIDQMRESRTVSISGRVGTAGKFDYRDNLTLGDLIVLAGGLKEDAAINNIEIVRRLSYAEADTSVSTGRKVQTITITRDLSIGTSGNSFLLEPFDEVLVRAVPSANIGGTVTLSGAFLTPGQFGLTSNVERLTDMVARSGGFGPQADINGARLFRPVKMTEKERQVRLRRNAASAIDTRDTLYYLKGEQAYELVSIDLAKAMADPSCDANIYLSDGDELQVPEMSQTVRVSGCVQNSTSLVWQNGWNAKDYVKASGGFSSKAKKRKTYVVYANGESKQVRHILFIRRYPKVTPGSEVVVPEKPERNLSTPSIISMSSSIVSMIAVIAALL